jgi:propionyl-CoA carboxylase alpha chain
VAALWIQGENRASAGALAFAPSGWRNARLPDQGVVLLHGESEVPIHYRRVRDGRFRLGDELYARVHAWSERGIDVEIDGRRLRARVTRDGDRLVVQGPRGDLELVEKPRFELPGAADYAGGFVTAMPGKVLELRVSVGDRVTAGETLVVLEAMKMEHPMRATEDGVVSEVRVAQGDQVEAGTVLLVVEPDGDEGDS